MKIHEMITQETWCKGNTAMTRDGELVSSADHPRACRWCALGWIFKAAHYGKERVLTDAIGLPTPRGPVTAIMLWNDQKERTFAEVKEAFKKADL